MEVNYEKLQLVIPDICHEKMYIHMMNRWEVSGEKIDPQLLSRYSGKTRTNVSYAKWLEWCEDDRTTGSNLSTKIPCTLYFLIQDDREIIGSIVINHENTHRGHLHAGIVPWHRGKGYGTIMLKLALEKCRDMGFKNVEIVPYKGNNGAVKTILNNGGILIDEFCEKRFRLQKGVWSQRYEIKL